MSIFSFQDVIYLGLIIVTSYVVNFYLNHFRRPDRLPGPLPLPLIGNLYQYTNDLSAWMNWLQTNYGGIGEIWFGGEKVIWLGKAEYLGKILKSSAGNYNLRTTPHEGLDILGMSSKGIIFNRNYDTWSINRKYFTRAISSAVFLRQSAKYTRSLFLEVEKYWEDLERRNIEIDMANWMLRFFAEATFLITTNKKCYALKNHHDVLCSSENEVADTEILIGHFKSIFDGFEFFLKTPKFMHDLPIFNKHVKKFLSSFDWMRKNYILGIVKKRREEIKRTPIDQELTSDMLTMMITFNTIRDTSQENTSTDKSLEPMSDEDICENLFEAAIAGIETTTDTFCYIVYYLCQYPEIKKCVSEEIQKVFGTNSKVDDIGYEELSKLNYCEAVIKEVSRIRTLSPLLLRMAEHSDEINGHKLEASTPIFINAQEIHMSELYWENPEIFDPGRFLTSADDKNVNNKIKKNSFLAFGGGIRVCPGRNLAIVELKTLMVLLFSKYKVEFVDPSAPIKAHCTVANHCDELKVKLVNIHN